MFDTNIQVADLRRPVGAAVHGLVKHLRLNVEALQRVLQAVHDVEHALHGNRVWTLAEVIFYGDEADSKLLELNLNDCSIELVAESASAVVCDDVLDVGLFMKVGEKLSKHRTVGDGLRRHARLDEGLPRDARPYLMGLRSAFLALGRDR